MKDYKNLHVYFSASSSKLTERKPLYEKIIKSIKGLGAKLTYDWLSDKEKLKPDEIFEKASEGIKEADVVIAEITYPSIGVGQQITLALSWKIPVVAIYQQNKLQASRFALGMKSPYLILKKYDKDNLGIILKDSIEDVIKERFVKFNFISTKEINDYLEEKSTSFSVSKSQLLRRIVREWMSKNK